MNYDVIVNRNALRRTKITGGGLDVRLMTLGRSLVFFLIALFGIQRAFGHSMYESAVILDFVGQQVRAEIHLPLQRMESVLVKPIDLRTLNEDQASITAYLLDRFRAKSAEGAAFQWKLGQPLSIETVDGAPYVIARLAFTPSTASQIDAFELEDDLLLDRISSQVTLVSVRSDWRSSVFANDPQLVGIVNARSRSVKINRAGESWLHGFGSIFRLGVRHISEGTDHLLFLLALLLPAPLLICRSRWVGYAGVRRSLWKILKVVTAFTIGHSLTLALAALGVVHVPSRPIEILIAVSILVSAIHAFRPLFPGREAAIACFFGLVHGLAFASTLSELGLTGWERVASIFGFNLGIEAMQLIVVAATMPSLLLLSRTSIYPPFRVTGATFAATVSMGWILERSFGFRLPIDLIVDGIAHWAGVLAGALAILSLATWLRYKRAPRSC